MLTHREFARLIQEARAEGKFGVWIATQALARGQGSLDAKVGKDGVHFYYTYRNGSGKRERIALGAFRSEGLHGLTLAQAADKARDLATIYRNETRNVRAYLEEQQRQETERLERRKQQRAPRPTLGELIDARLAYLLEQGKEKSAKNEASALRNTFAALLAKPADEITPEEISSAINAVLARGKHRLADIARAYLNAAYNNALHRNRPGMQQFLPFTRIRQNPVATIGQVHRTQARERCLTHAELWEYIRWLEEGALSPVLRIFLRCQLHLGGQRFEQLARLQWPDVDWDRETLALEDPKGRRQVPRRHYLPLTPRVREELLQVQVFTDGSPWVFPAETKDGHVSAETVSKAIRRWNKGAWQARDIRRTVETELARLRVPKDVRSHLLSHGLTGVQHVHYDRHDYLAEMRDALMLLEEFLEKGLGASVKV